MPADNDNETIGSPESTVTTQEEAGSRRGQRDAAAAALEGVDHQPGAAKPDPILVADNILNEAIDAGYISSSIINNTQVGQFRFMMVGLLLMLLMIFRPQGIFGDRREIALDAR